MNMPAIKVRQAEERRDFAGRIVEIERPNFTELLSSVSNLEAPDILRGFIAERAGLPGANAKAKALAKNRELSANALYRHFESQRAMQVRDLPQLFSSLLTLIKVEPSTPAHRKITRFFQAKDFRPHDFVTGSDNLACVVVPEGGEVPFSKLSANVESITIESHRIRVPVSRHDLLSGAVEWVQIPSLMLNAAYREEQSSVYKTLENPVNLADGGPVFDDSNSSTGQLDDLGALLAKYRSQINVADPKFLVCPSAHEISLANQLYTAGLNEKIELISTAEVTNSYLIADPAQQPVLIRLALADLPTIETRLGAFESDASILLDLYSDYAVKLISRAGIVKISAGS